MYTLAPIGQLLLYYSQLEDYRSKSLTTLCDELTGWRATQCAKLSALAKLAAMSLNMKMCIRVKKKDNILKMMNDKQDIANVNQFVNYQLAHYKNLYNELQRRYFK